jgi:FtsH-binding integral membrane protein
MSRRIITSPPQVAAPGAPQPTVDTFFDKLYKYIPADVVAFYVFVSGLLDGADLANKQVIYWVVVVIGLVAAFFWTLRQTQQPGMNPAYKQAAISTVAVLVWIFALGGPFSAFAWYNSILGAILLAAFTLLIPLVNPD